MKYKRCRDKECEYKFPHYHKEDGVYVMEGSGDVVEDMVEGSVIEDEEKIDQA